MKLVNIFEENNLNIPNIIGKLEFLINIGDDYDFLSKKNNDIFLKRYLFLNKLHNCENYEIFKVNYSNLLVWISGCADKNNLFCSIFDMNNLKNIKFVISNDIKFIITKNSFYNIKGYIKNELLFIENLNYKDIKTNDQKNFDFFKIMSNNATDINRVCIVKFKDFKEYLNLNLNNFYLVIFLVGENDKLTDYDNLCKYLVKNYKIFCYSILHFDNLDNFYPLPIKSKSKYNLSNPSFFKINNTKISIFYDHFFDNLEKNIIFTPRNNNNLDLNIIKDYANCYNLIPLYTKSLINYNNYHFTDKKFSPDLYVIFSKNKNTMLYNYNNEKILLWNIDIDTNNVLTFDISTKESSSNNFIFKKFN